MTPPSSDGFLINYPVTKKRSEEIMTNNLNSAIESTTSRSSSESQPQSQPESHFDSFQSVGFSQECRKYISASDDGELWS